MSTIDVNIHGDYDPKMVIVVYQMNRDFYLESHRILKNGTLGAGKPLTSGQIKQIADNFTSKKIKNLKKKVERLQGYLTPDMLYFNQNEAEFHLAWTKKKCEEHLYFDKELNIKDGYAEVPNLFFIWNSTLKVFAVKERPATLDTRLYEAPFSNISSTGSVCLGSARKDKNPATFITAMRSFEGAFFNSRFTNEHTDRKVASVSVFELWKDNIKNDKKFNNDNLVPHCNHATIRDALQGSFGKEALRS